MVSTLNLTVPGFSSGCGSLCGFSLGFFPHCRNMHGWFCDQSTLSQGVSVSVNSWLSLCALWWAVDQLRVSPANYPKTAGIGCDTGRDPPEKRLRKWMDGAIWQYCISKICEPVKCENTVLRSKTAWKVFDVMTERCFQCIWRQSTVFRCCSDRLYCISTFWRSCSCWESALTFKLIKWQK